MWLIFLLLIILFWMIIASIEIVKENTVYVVEFLGKFSRIMTAGLNFRVPLVEHIAERITLKQQNFSVTGRYHAKDKVVVDISSNIIFAVIPTAEGVSKHTYTLVDREKTLTATIENALRASVARETYNDVLAKKEALTKEIWTDLDHQFKEWGIDIISFQITGVRSVPSY